MSLKAETHLLVARFVCVCVFIPITFFVNPVRSAVESVTVHPEQWLPLSMSVLPESVVRFHINGYIFFN